MTSPLDDLAASIGFNATATLVAWYGDSRLYVPSQTSPTHILNAILGEQTFAKLVADFGGTDIFVCNALVAERVARDKKIVALAKSYTTSEIAAQTGLGVRRVQKILKKFFGTGDFPANGTCEAGDVLEPGTAQG